MASFVSGGGLAWRCDERKTKLIFRHQGERGLLFVKISLSFFYPYSSFSQLFSFIDLLLLLLLLLLNVHD